MFTLIVYIQFTYHCLFTVWEQGKGNGKIQDSTSQSVIFTQIDFCRLVVRASLTIGYYDIDYYYIIDIIINTLCFRCDVLDCLPHHVDGGGPAHVLPGAADWPVRGEGTNQTLRSDRASNEGTVAHGFLNSVWRILV